MTGCDTTSRLFEIDKQLALKKLKSDPYLQEQAVIKAGEKVIVSLYGELPLEGLDLCRWRKFTPKTMSVRQPCS
jgi:hypothetical protein